MSARSFAPWRLHARFVRWIPGMVALDMVFAVARRLRWPAATSGAANFREWLAATHPEFLAALPPAA